MTTLTPEHFTAPELERIGNEAYSAAVRSNGGSSRGVVRPTDLGPFLATQISRAELETLTGPEITAAHEQGRLAALTVAPEAYGRAMAEAGERPERLGAASNAADATAGNLTNRLTRADLAGMTPREIADAYSSGRLAHLTGGQTSTVNGATALDVAPA